MKICLECKHCDFDGGERDWSDVTPGREARISCYAGKYGDEALFDHDERSFFKFLSQAETCDSFEYAKEETP